VDFQYGLAKNERLIAAIAPELERAAAKSRRSGRPARRFKSFMWRTRTTWSRKRHVVAKAECTQGGPIRALCHARGVQAEVPLRAVYCARGDMENRIKECQLDLYADRTSAATMRANQLRPLVPLHGLCPAVRSAPDRPPRYRLRARDLRHHSSQAAQDRRARSHQRPSHQDRTGVSLSGRSRVGSCRLAIAALARASPA